MNGPTTFRYADGMEDGVGVVYGIYSDAFSLTVLRIDPEPSPGPFCNPFYSPPPRRVSAGEFRDAVWEALQLVMSVLRLGQAQQRTSKL